MHVALILPFDVAHPANAEPRHRRAQKHRIIGVGFPGYEMRLAQTDSRDRRRSRPGRDRSSSRCRASPFRRAGSSAESYESRRTGPSARRDCVTGTSTSSRLAPRPRASAWYFGTLNCA